MSQTTVTKTETIELPIIADGDKIDLMATAKAIYEAIPEIIHEQVDNTINPESATILTLKETDSTFTGRWAEYFLVDGKPELMAGFEPFEQVIQRINQLRLAGRERGLDEEQGVPTSLEKCDFQSIPGGNYVLRYRGARGWRTMTGDDESCDGWATKAKYLTEAEVIETIRQSRRAQAADSRRDICLQPFKKLTPAEKQIKEDAKACHIYIRGGRSYDTLFGDTYTFYKKHVAWCRKNLEFDWKGRDGSKWEDRGSKTWDVKNREVCNRIFEVRWDEQMNRREEMEDDPRKFIDQTLYDLILKRADLAANDVLWTMPYDTEDNLHAKIIRALKKELRCPPQLNEDRGEFDLIIKAVVKNDLTIDREPHINALREKHPDLEAEERALAEAEAIV